MTTTQETRSDRTDGPIHGHFGLTYAQYQVLNRTLMQSMPVEWQERMVGCLDELHAAFEHVEQPESYIIKPAREATYSDLSEAEMVLLNVSRPDSADHEDIADVYYDDDGVEHSPDDRVYIPTGADPIPHYRRGYVEPNIPAAVEGGAVTREPSDIWRAYLCDIIGIVKDLADIDWRYDAPEIHIVRRSALPDETGKLPKKYADEDVAHIWDYIADEEMARQRYALGQAMAAGLNAPDPTR